MANSISSGAPQLSGLDRAHKTLSGALQAQDQRFLVITENMANAETVPSRLGQMPYQRKMPVFEARFDRRQGYEKIRVKGMARDKTPFKREYLPGHPAADADGWVLKPNIEPTKEMVDMLSTKRTYEALLRVYKSATMLKRHVISLIK